MAVATAQKKQGTRATQKEARPKEIVEAALEIFARDGFAGTRLDDVADQVGISKGTIYLYFDTKEELFKACVRQTIGAHLADTRDLAAHFEGDTADLLYTIVQDLGQRLTQGGFQTILILMVSEGKRFPELVSFYYEEIISSGLQILRTVIQGGVDRGEFRNNALSDYPQLLVSPVMMSVIWNHLFAEKGGSLDIEAALETHMDTLLVGLKKT